MTDRSSDDIFKAWHVTINDPHYWDEEADLGIHYFDTRNQARALGAHLADQPYTIIRAVRAPHWDIEKVPGAFLQNGRVVMPGERK